MSETLFIADEAEEVDDSLFKPPHPICRCVYIGAPLPKRGFKPMRDYAWLMKLRYKRWGDWLFEGVDWENRVITRVSWKKLDNKKLTWGILDQGVYVEGEPVLHYQMYPEMRPRDRFFIWWKTYMDKRI